MVAGPRGVSSEPGEGGDGGRSETGGSGGGGSGGTSGSGGLAGQTGGTTETGGTTGGSGQASGGITSETGGTSTGGVAESSGGTTGGTAAGGTATGGAFTGGTSTGGATTGGTSTGGAATGGVSTGGSGPTEPDGYTCESALPFSEETLTLNGDTCEAGTDVALDENCSPIADHLASPDVVFRFTPSETATYDIALDTEQGAWDAVLTMGPICGEPGQNGEWCSDQGGPNELLEFVSVEAGITYFIVVDGWASDTGHEPSCGPFTLTFTRID
jgi:hypothetical protein